ncbi:MAG: M15 family metallopeptidase [Myxococcota bacterium]
MVPIVDDGEPLVELRAGLLSLAEPHPYVALGAPYGPVSPWALRRTVAEKLLAAQAQLSRERPGWRLHVLDALRPVAVQAFMVAWTDRQLARDEPQLSAEARAARVRQFWAMPSEDPRSPPPHSTGAALDVTLVDEHARELDMGSPFDEPTERSYPQHFAHATDAAGQRAHAHRELLYRLLSAVGFRRHPREWWHFSYGDQAWAAETGAPAARYGRAGP